MDAATDRAKLKSDLRLISENALGIARHNARLELLDRVRAVDAATRALKRAEAAGASVAELEALRAAVAALSAQVLAQVGDLADRLAAVEARPTGWRFVIERDADGVAVAVDAVAVD